ncbi:MAG: phosphoribosylaminoimidazolesuccinocarboxamide synthase [Armatimonadetes bacterium]|nr:phosphoribosylaminoimidazolesuccinocarboxamide synthase [Armatimonadota bacterium]
MTTPLLTADIPGLSRFTTGKVRDVYDLGDALLLVTTDRLSAFDVVLPDPIPDKGRVLTGLSRFWFERTRDILPNHLIAADMDSIGQRLHDAGVNVTPDLVAMLEGRSLLVQKCRALPVECVVRGYLAGSAWKDYQKLFAHGGEVRLYDLPLPVGLRESDRLPAPLFTPATKAAVGAHDENIPFARAAEIIGPDLAAAVRDKSLALYAFARDYAAARGIIIADTKFEFGLRDDSELILIDEALTPDSSRFWDAALYKPGRPQPSFDKQFVRDYLETQDWNKTPPAPALPPEIIAKTAEKYRDAYRLLTGQPLQ